MICERLNPGQWRLSFSEPEAIFIINILARLQRHYAEDITHLPPAVRGYWQGGPAPEKGELKESQEVLAEAREELRSERQALAENWIREFEIAEKRDPWIVEVTTSERDEFVSMLNDRRLMLALESGISDHDMESDPGQIANEARRAAILEIDVLGHFILVILGPQIYRP